VLSVAGDGEPPPSGEQTYEMYTLSLSLHQINDWREAGVLLSPLQVDNQGSDERLYSLWIVDETDQHAEATWQRFRSTHMPDFPSSAVLRRDEDVLDTWFSSGLLPLSALGWPWKSGEAAHVGPGDIHGPGMSDADMKSIIHGKVWGNVEVD